MHNLKWTDIYIYSLIYIYIYIFLRACLLSLVIIITYSCLLFVIVHLNIIYVTICVKRKCMSSTTHALWQNLCFQVNKRTPHVYESYTSNYFINNNEAELMLLFSNDSSNHRMNYSYCMKGVFIGIIINLIKIS